ncbi:heparan-alpha-glucosaminide N-acetyltransferase-like [Trichogramma pretiosum]|uniref:heparan-alpha-glucosaminide N-acetyltransferase-like n=1 Tax=Trichogramma pretiosum TaxID=7493 RepID=UPI0006C9AFBC|nr:heparan-alpha-glucosaminide N-acetyltransferase-like [Trichogramma pretiosum]
MYCTYEDLRHDEACVGVTNAANKSRLWLYSLSADCDACPYTRVTPISTGGGANLTVDTSRWQTWRIVDVGDDEANEHLPAAHQKVVYCELTPDLGQYGIYELKINNANECDLLELRQPVNPYTTLAVTAAAVVVLLSLLSILKNISACIRKHRAKRNGGNDEDEESRVVLQPKRRIRSIDTIRGMSILTMIFVNNGAGGYVWLEHATWNGLAAGDLVFPCFMWIMGVCIPLSISSQLSPGRANDGSGSNNKRRYSVCLAIVKRSLYLFFIGLSLNTLGGQTQLENIRIFGVLQRFAVAYLFVGIIYALMYRKDSKNLSGRLFGDVLILLPQWFVALAVLAAHCAITFLLQVPGCPKGYLGPGGYHEEGKYFECAGGATGYIDKLLLGRSHVYQHPTIDRVYESGPFDPEGILGCLTSIFQVFLGVQSGQILREHKSSKARVSRWLSWACILGVVGAALHYTDVVPVNKNLWSISFALVTTSFSLVLLSISYLLVDAAALWNGGPFRIPGMNALVMYCGHQVFYAMFPFHWQYGRMESHHGWLLAESLWCCSLWICIAYLMHRRKIYVTL